jgi:hypothetical protein
MISKPEFGRPIDQTSNCDNPLHGYNCFHLDEDFSKLTKSEEKEYKRLKDYFGFETVNEVDKAIEEDRTQITYKEEEIGDLQEGIDEMEELKRLIEKKGA